MITIGKGVAWYRPYRTRVNGVERIVDKIHIYNEDGIILTIGQGWLESGVGFNRKDIEHFDLEVDELKLKRKEKFDGTVFILSVKSDYSNEKKCDLYIPNSLVQFKKVKRHITKGYSWSVVDTWESEILGATYEQYRHDLRVGEKLVKLKEEFETVKKHYEFEVDSEDILEKINTLMELKAEYDKEVERIENIDLDLL